MRFAPVEFSFGTNPFHAGCSYLCINCSRYNTVSTLCAFYPVPFVPVCDFRVYIAFRAVSLFCFGAFVGFAAMQFVGFYVFDRFAPI